MRRRAAIGDWSPPRCDHPRYRTVENYAGSVRGSASSWRVKPGSGRAKALPPSRHPPAQTAQISSGCISIAPHGHSAAQMPQPLQKS